MDPQQKPLLIGALVFITTLGWVFFIDQMRITPDLLLTSIGNVQVLGLFLSVAFAGFVFMFCSTIGLITAYADKDDRTQVYLATIIPSVLACGISALLFSNFAQWYPLALFYFGSIPLMIETSRLKRLELKNFVIFRSSFSGAQRGLQVIGIGVLVSLAVVALPQSTTLYKGFEDSLFAGKVIQQLDVQKITTDYLITTQRNTLLQIINSDSFSTLRGKTDQEVLSFVQLMDATLANVNSPEYRDKINEQVAQQQKNLDTQELLSQIQSKVPGYGTVKDYYWAVAAFLGSTLFFLVAMFVLQPFSAVMGSVIYTLIPDGTSSPTYSSQGSEHNTSGGWATPETTPAHQEQSTGWDSPTNISSEENVKTQTPTYTHVEEPAPAVPTETPPQ